MSSDEDSDSDGRLSPPLLFFDPTKVFPNVKPKSVGDLLIDTSSIIGDLINIKSTFQPLVKDTHESAGQAEKFQGPDIEKPEPDCSIKPSIVPQKFFGESGYLQFFSLKDLDLLKYGYCNTPTELLTKTEKTLLSWSSETLQSIFSYALKGFSNGSFIELNPIIHYALGLVSVHEEFLVVDSCAKFVKRMLREHLNVASISFTSEEIFSILFNHGVDIKNAPIFEILPLSKITKVKELVIEKTNKQPQNWKYNLQSVLSCLTDIFQYCKFNKSDLRDILLYLLMMCVDESIRASFIYLELQKCLCNVLLSIGDNLWPSCVSWTLSTLTSKTRVLPAAQKWGFVLQMTRAIPFVLSQGIQLRTQLAFVSIRHICDQANIRAPYGYPKEGEVMSEFIEFLESLPHVSRSLQNVCIDFMGVFLVHHQFISEEEYTDVCRALKVCEKTVTQGSYEDDNTSEVSVITLALQLVKIYSTLKLLPPNYKVLKEDSCDTDEIDTLPTAENNTETSYPLLKPSKPINGYNFKLKGETVLSENCMAMNRSVSVMDKASSSKFSPDNLTISGKPSFQSFEGNGYCDKENYEAMDVEINTTVVKKSDELKIQSSTSVNEMSATSLPDSSVYPDVNMPNNPYSFVSLDSTNDDLIDQTICSKKNEFKTEPTSCQTNFLIENSVPSNLNLNLISNKDYKPLPTAKLEGENSTDTASEEENFTDTASEEENSTDTASEDESSSRFSPLILSKRKHDFLPKLSPPLPSKSMSFDKETSDLSAKQVSSLPFENPLKCKTASSKSSTEPSPDMLSNSNLISVSDSTTDSIPSLKIGNSLSNKTNLSSNDISISNSASDSSPSEISSLELEYISKSEVTSSKSPGPVLPSISNQVSYSNSTTDNTPSLHIEDSLANETSLPVPEFDSSVTLSSNASKSASESFPNEVSNFQLQYTSKSETASSKSSVQPCQVLPPDYDSTTDNTPSLHIEDSLAKETTLPVPEFDPSVTLSSNASKSASESFPNEVSNLKLQYASKSETALSESSVLPCQVIPPDSDSTTKNTSSLHIEDSLANETSLPVPEFNPSVTSEPACESSPNEVSSLHLQFASKSETASSKSSVELGFESRPDSIQVSTSDTSLKDISEFERPKSALVSTLSSNSMSSHVFTVTSDDISVLKTRKNSSAESNLHFKSDLSHSSNTLKRPKGIKATKANLQKLSKIKSFEPSLLADLNNCCETSVSSNQSPQSCADPIVKKISPTKFLSKSFLIWKKRLSVDNKPDFVCKKDTVFVSSFCASKIGNQSSIKSGSKANSLDFWQNRLNTLDDSDSFSESATSLSDKVQDSHECLSTAVESIKSLSNSSSNEEEKSDATCINSVEIQSNTFSNVFKESKGGNILPKSMEHIPLCSSGKSSNIIASNTTTLQPRNSLPTLVDEMSLAVTKDISLSSHSTFANNGSMREIISKDGLKSVPDQANPYCCPSTNSHFKFKRRLSVDNKPDFVCKKDVVFVSSFCANKISGGTSIKFSSKANSLDSWQSQLNPLDDSDSFSESATSLSDKVQASHKCQSIAVESIKSLSNSSGNEEEKRETTCINSVEIQNNTFSNAFKESKGGNILPKSMEHIPLCSSGKSSNIIASDSTTLQPHNSFPFLVDEISLSVTKDINSHSTFANDGSMSEIISKDDLKSVPDLANPYWCPSKNSHFKRLRLSSPADLNLFSNLPSDKKDVTSNQGNINGKLELDNTLIKSPIIILPNSPTEVLKSVSPEISFQNPSRSLVVTLKPFPETEDGESLHQFPKTLGDSKSKPFSESSNCSSFPEVKDILQPKTTYKPSTITFPTSDSFYSSINPSKFTSASLEKCEILCPLSNPIEDSESPHPASKLLGTSDSSPLFSRPIEDYELSHPAPKLLGDCDSSHPAPKPLGDIDSSHSAGDRDSSHPAPKLLGDRDSSHSSPPSSKPIEDSESSHPAPKLLGDSNSLHSSHPLSNPIEDSESSHPAPKLLGDIDSSHPAPKLVGDRDSSHPAPQLLGDRDSSHSSPPLSKPIEDSESSHPAPKLLGNSDSSHPAPKLVGDSDSSHPAPKLVGDGDSSYSSPPLSKPIEDSESSYPAPKLLGDSNSLHSSHPLSKSIEDSESSHPAPKLLGNSDSPHSSPPLSKPIEDSESSHPAPKVLGNSDSSPLSKPIEDSESSHPAPKLLGYSDSSHSSPLSKLIEDYRSSHSAPKVLGNCDSSHSFHPLSKPIEDSESSRPTSKLLGNSGSSHSTPKSIKNCVKDSESLKPPSESSVDSSSICLSPVKEKTPESCAKTSIVKSELTLSPSHKPYPNTMHQMTLSSVSPLRISNVKSGLPSQTPIRHRKSVCKHSTQSSIVSFLVKKESSLEKPISSKAANSNLIDNGVNSVAKNDSGPEKQSSEDSRTKTLKRQNQNLGSPSKRSKIPPVEQTVKLSDSDESDIEVLFYRVRGPVNKTIIDLSSDKVDVDSSANITSNHEDDDIVVMSEVIKSNVTVADHDIITID